MAYALNTTMFVALLFTFAISFSLGHTHREDDSDNETILRHLCSQIERSKECTELVKSELTKFEDSDSNDVAGPIMDLTNEKAEQIRDMLKELHEDSNDDKLKEKYESCSSNYNDASRDLDVAKKSFDSNDYQDITEQVDDIVHELDECTREFDDGTFDPAHIGDRNKEFGLYVDLLKVAMDRLLTRNDNYDINCDDHDNYDECNNYRN